MNNGHPGSGGGRAPPAPFTYGDADMGMGMHPGM